MRFIIFIIFISLSKLMYSQNFFNDYQSLKAVGDIPHDFSTSTYEKINREIQQNTDTSLTIIEQKLFLQKKYYGVDELLHSGLVVYGDEVSLYIKKIVDKLLVNETDLKSKLRFYTIKSNQANALSTDQGIIFVTTGLISQLTCEAQLALILAHEIAHYQKNHIAESFEYTQHNKDVVRNIRKLSTYSKEKELEADKLGLKWYNEGGYSLAEVVSTFDVIMYSYLPFDEVEFPNTYFNSNEMFIPESFFPTEKFEIKAIENYDDSESSHPNIKTRKNKIEEECLLYETWGNNQYLLDPSDFIRIRNICRFERIRTDVINQNYLEAIYSIFILEQEFSTSIYLKHMKAQAWLGIIQTEKTIKNNKEGEIGTLYSLNNKLNKNALNTLGIRQIYDLKRDNPTDIQFNLIFDRAIKKIASTDDFKFESYSKYNFQNASVEFLMNKNNPEKIDSISYTNKYDKIKSKKNTSSIDNFDSTKFYLYGLSDLIIDTDFQRLYAIHKAEKDSINTVASNDSVQKNEISNEITNSKIIILEPSVYSTRKRELNLMKSEELSRDFSEAIEIVASDLNLTVSIVNKTNLAEKGTEAFNTKNNLMSFLIQSFDNPDAFPVDFDRYNEIIQQYGTNKIIFPIIGHNYSIMANSQEVGYIIQIYPVIPFYLLFKVLMKAGNLTTINVMSFDLEKASLENTISYDFKDAPGKYQLGAHLYTILKNQF